MKYNLTENELLKIKSLIKNNTNIYKLYQILYNLEIENKKDSKEYQKHLEYLNIYIEIENKLYNEINNTSLIEIAKFIYNYTSKYSKDIKEIILKQEYEILILFRILQTVTSKITKSSHKIHLSKKDQNSLLTILNIKNNNQISFSNLISLHNQIETDTSYTFITFLQNYISDEKFKYQKDKLINTLYNISFINKDIESYALSSNFSFPKELSIYSKVYVDFLNINISIYKKIKDNYSQNIANTQIYELLEIKDIEYNDKDIVTESILRQCILKSAFLIMSDETINNTNYSFHEYIEDKEYEIIHPNSKISENIIINLFKNIKKDKEKVKIISLKI